MNLLQCSLWEYAFQDNEDIHGPREQEKGLVLLHSIYRPPGYCLWLQWREEVGKPDSHALEHLGAGVKGQNGGGADTRTVQQPQGQALHEGEG